MHMTASTFINLNLTAPEVAPEPEPGSESEPEAEPEAESESPNFPALLMNSLSIQLTDRRFANISGSAILIVNGVDTTVTNSAFVNNSGGAIYDEASRSTTITNSSFQNNSNHNSNSSIGWGGAIYSGSSDLNIEQSEFLGNIAADGGAVFMSGRKAHISDCVFTENGVYSSQHQEGSVAPFSDTQDGGAIYFYNSGSDSQITNKDFDVVNSTFIGNWAVGSAGAILSWQVQGLVAVNQCSFAQNKGLSLAADLYVFGDNQRLTNVTVSNSHFTESQVSASIDIRSVRCFGMINTTFVNSTKPGLEILDVGGQCENTVSDEFDSNSVSADSAALFDRYSISADAAAVTSIGDFIGHDIAYSISIDIRGCRFDNISSRAVGIKGGLNSRIVVAQTEFVAGYSGATLDLTACENVVVWGCTFQDNINFQNGAAISSQLNLGAGMFIGNSKFRNNSALSGGAVYGSAGAQFNITGNSYFANNSANTTAGAIQCNSCGLLALWQGTILQNNLAGQDGGGL